MNYVIKKIAFNEISDYSQIHNIAVCTDANVVRAMGVLLFSIFKNNRFNYAIHIFFKGMITNEDKNKISQLSDMHRCPIIIYFINDEDLCNLHYTVDISITAYYRLLMPYILEKLGLVNILYLDVDMLCVGDIEGLFYKKLCSNIAYVTAGFTSVPRWWNQYCKSIQMKGSRYFNSGMMLINIPEYIKNDIGNKAIQLASKKNYKYMDQDVLNILLEDRVIFDTSSEYNCTMSVRNHEFNKNTVKIIHFTGNKKPWKLYTTSWNKKGHLSDKAHSWKYSYYERWRIYAEQSPWRDVPYDKPETYTEWRYLSNMYRQDGKYKSAISSYIKYLSYKLKLR